MKKYILVLMSALIIFVTSGCGKKLETYNEITIDEYNKLIEKKESFPLVVGSATCSACASFRVTMEVFIKNNQINVKYIDLDKVSEEQYNTLKSQLSFSGTPTTVFIKEGKITSFYNRIDGAASMNDVRNYYKTNGYIK